MNSKNGDILKQIAEPKFRVHTKINRELAMRYLGYRGQNISDELLESFEEVALYCEDNFDILGAWKTLAIKENTYLKGNKGDGGDYKCGKTRYVLLEGGLILKGESISHFLEHATDVVIMACTLGAKYEQKIEELEASDVPRALYLDACGSALIEAGAQKCQAKISKQIISMSEKLPTNLDFKFSSKKDIGTRFSPGYGDFSLDIQPRLLQILDASKNIGLYTTSSNMLIPQKSITAIIGLELIEN